MELHDWLLQSRYITREGYKRIVGAQFWGTLADVEFDKEDCLSQTQSKRSGPDIVRRHPIGDVIDHLRDPDKPPQSAEIYRAAGVCNLAELVEKWQQWHREHYVPIASYSTASRFGNNLYNNLIEKRLVAEYVNRQKVGNSTLIRDTDTVVIPEGSSSFHIGLAIAAAKRKASIVTSNVALCREYTDNPAVAQAYYNFHIVGGLVDRDPDLHQTEHGGTFGPDAEHAYETAIQQSPTVTVVVMPVSGLLATDGPYATDEFVRRLKYSIIRASLLDKTKVREFLFIADYSKHLPDSVDSYGAPVMERDDWKRLISENRQRVHLVTVPPPALRAALAVIPPHQRTHLIRRSIDDMNSPLPFTNVDRAYVRSIADLAEMFQDGKQRSTIHEAVSTANCSLKKDATEFRQVLI